MVRHLWIAEGGGTFYQPFVDRESAERLLDMMLPHRERRLYRVELGEPVKVLPAKETT